MPVTEKPLILVVVLVAIAALGYVSYYLLRRSPLRPKLSKLKQALIQKLIIGTKPLRKSFLLNFLGFASGVDWLISIIDQQTWFPQLLLWLISQDYGRTKLNVSLAVYLPIYYDDVTYFFLTNDRPRNERYINSINALVKDKIVVEIGTGKDAILSRFCCQAGARKVYTIEINQRVYEQAKKCIADLGLSDKIQIIYGDGQAVEIPELADVCVSELLGSIASSEGVSPIINSSRRFLKPNGLMLPSRSLTKIAAITIPDGLMTFNQVDQYFINKVFRYIGYPFDIRVGIYNFPPENIISSTEVYEDLDFNHPVPEETQTEVTFTITKAGRLDGFLLWLILYTDPEQCIDALIENTNWLPTFFPVFYPGLAVDVGDRITAVCEVKLSSNKLNPDYHIHGQLLRQNAEPVNFSYWSYYQNPSFRANPFYAKIFSPQGQVIINPQIG